MAGNVHKEEELFFNAIEIASSERRDAYLDQACDDNVELRRRVEALLRRHLESRGPLDTPLFGVDVTANLPPIGAQPDSVSLHFLEPCDVPGRLGKIGPYEVLDLIGRGGMGVVCKAVDPVLARTVAIKVLASPPASSARERFRREARAVAAVKSEHVVVIHAVEETAEPPYLVMEYVEGISLQERLDRSGPLEIAEIVRIGAQIARGLAAAHAQGLIHRDVKPANILLTEASVAKVTDFGIGKLLTGDTDLTTTGQMVGSPAYMSPEQVRGDKLDVRSDIFSLGVVLYQTLTLKKPFPADTLTTLVYQILHQEPDDPLDHNSELPPEISEIVRKCLAKNRDERYGDAAELADDLRALIGIAPLVSTAGLLKFLREDPRLWWGALVTSWFWLVGAVALSLMPPLVKNVLGGNEDVVTACLAIAGCGSSQDIDKSTQYGPSPALPDPSRGLLPRMNVPKVIGWNDGATPTVPQGFRIEAIATGLSNPRNVYPLENGDLLIYPEGDRKAPASGRMPKGYYFFDTIVRQPPVSGLNDASIVNAEGLQVLRVLFHIPGSPPVLRTLKLLAAPV